LPTLHIPGRDDASIARTQWEALELLQNGVPVNPNRKLCKSLQSVAAYYEHWNTARLNAYMTDGVVVKLNSLRFKNRWDLPKVSSLGCGA